MESKEREKCGYDLLCTKGRKQRHVEVKGVSGSEWQVEILILQMSSKPPRPTKWPSSFATCYKNALDLRPGNCWRWDSQEFLDNFCVTPLTYWVEGNLSI